MKLPKTIKLGHFNIKIKPLPNELASSDEQEGSFHGSTRTIYIDENIIEKGGVDLVSVLLHELLHVSYYKNNLSKDSKEEDLANAFSNDLTELFSRTKLLDIINTNLRGKNYDNKS
jgi:hypothetical protein|tara:strand:- start:568 stop:915 length:348 start_codon:yes stop_codon:yes gene_type:complete